VRPHYERTARVQATPSVVDVVDVLEEDLVPDEVFVVPADVDVVDAVDVDVLGEVVEVVVDVVGLVVVVVVGLVVGDVVDVLFFDFVFNRLSSASTLSSWS
jgi:hypothetical protein